MASAQGGKTEVILNIIAYFAHHDPSPMLAVYPTLDIAEAVSKDRIAPMFRDTPALQEIAGETGAKKSASTLLHKIFPNGHLTLAGSNSPASLSSRPVRIVLGDEVDRFAVSAGPEGDPWALACERAANFWNAFKLLASTPTRKGFSRIEAAYEASDQRRFWAPCPHCGEFQILIWAQVRWEKNRPETARYHCRHCDAAWTDAERNFAVHVGHWRKGRPQNRKAGFHFNKLYSPWLRLVNMVRSFLEAKKLPETLKVWVNTNLGETWEGEGETVQAELIYQQRRRPYQAWVALPEEVLAITAGIDTQKDRLEVELLGTGADQQSWSLALSEHQTGAIVLLGDPTRPEVWAELDKLLVRVFYYADGRPVRISAACIDSGYATEDVYRYCAPRFLNRVFAIKGRGGAGLPVIVSAPKNNAYNVPVFNLGVDRLKELFYSRLGISEPGPGFCHFPLEYRETYFEQLTAERAVRRFRAGQPVLSWELKPGTRNEALDCRVYAMAALAILNPDWRALQEGRRAGASVIQAATAQGAAPRRRRVRSQGVI